MEASWGVTRPWPPEPNFGGLGHGTAYKERVRFPPAPGITLFVSERGESMGKWFFQAPPLFEETFVTPQCDFPGGLPPKTTDACLSWTAVVAWGQPSHHS